jgi:hypothetical protein
MKGILAVDSERTEQNTLQLPLTIVGRVDVARVARELEGASEALTQAGLRAKTDTKMPRTSQLLDDFLHLNQLDLLRPADRKRTKQFFTDLRESAPVLHMSFAVDPSAPVVEKIITWLRREVHPMVLLQVGLQPDIGAGFILRTPNRSVDCSLRESFAHTREQLIGALRGAPSG